MVSNYWERDDMANRISNRGALTLRTASWVSPPQRAVIPPPIVYTAITTLTAQPASTGGVNAWNGVTIALGREL